MKNWTIGTQLTLGLVANIATIIVIGLLAYTRLQTMKADVNRMAGDSMAGTAVSSQLTTAVTDHYLLTVKRLQAQSASEIRQIEDRSTTTEGQIAKLLADYERTITQADDRKHYASIQPERERYLKVRAEVFSADQAARPPEAVAALSRSVDSAYAPYVGEIHALQDWKIKAGSDFGALAGSDARAGVIWLVGGSLIVATFGALLGFFLVGGVTRTLNRSSSELRENSERVVLAASQVATSAHRLSGGATEQAATLEETSASMEEMASMTRKNAENAKEAAALVTEVAREMSDSDAALGGMVASMDALRQSSAKVAKIIKTIDEIAFQTNILALNAAVEAARAGEAGMGFAVVADEVRHLAQRSAQAAKDTAGLIEESMARSEEGSGRVVRMAATIGTIAVSVTKVKGIIEEVRESSRQQTLGIEQVTQAVAQMERVTQATAATAVESASASEELNAQAEASMVVVRRLEFLVGAGVSIGHAGAARRAPDTSELVPMVRKAMRRVPGSKAEQEFPLAETRQAAGSEAF